ncbi:hypothetical protein BHM03_00040545 [Ensete ventricosum]|uniref:Uncharacterized protein n=1 Tax=Ensete ventricosum TaxID=4639 RepID=A0A445MKK4_ENSVE|nr:hypothetical protein BHM03_00040545 [Ensete ventricosum]
MHRDLPPRHRGSRCNLHAPAVPLYVITNNHKHGAGSSFYLKGCANPLLAPICVVAAAVAALCRWRRCTSSVPQLASWRRRLVRALPQLAAGPCELATAPEGGRPMRAAAPVGGRLLQGAWLQPAAPIVGGLAAAGRPLAGRPWL